MAKRDDVYTLDEELPKRVKSRLVSQKGSCKDVVLTGRTKCKM